MSIFDVTVGQLHPTSDKTRSATANEMEFYIRSLQSSRGLPHFNSLKFVWACEGADFPNGATFGKETSKGVYETGAYSIPMPGAQTWYLRAKVTMETLDESGAVVKSATVFPDARTGKIAIKAVQVKAAAGPVEKPAKAPRKANATVTALKEEIASLRAELAASRQRETRLVEFIDRTVDGRRAINRRFHKERDRARRALDIAQVAATRGVELEAKLRWKDVALKRERARSYTAPTLDGFVGARPAGRSISLAAYQRQPVRLLTGPAVEGVA